MASNSQVPAPNVDKFVDVPVSPEAQAFENYGNVPVSYYTGKPNVRNPYIQYPR